MKCSKKFKTLRVLTMIVVIFVERIVVHVDLNEPFRDKGKFSNELQKVAHGEIVVLDFKKVLWYSIKIYIKYK